MFQHESAVDRQLETSQRKQWEAAAGFQEGYIVFGVARVSGLSNRRQFVAAKLRQQQY